MEVVVSDHWIGRRVSCSNTKIVVKTCKLSNVWPLSVEIVGVPLILCLLACFIAEKNEGKVGKLYSLETF